MRTTTKALCTVFCAVLCTFVAACDEPAAREAGDAVTAREGSIDPCEGLTPATLQATIDALEDAVALAEANAEAITNDAYPAATQLAITHLGQARDYMVELQAWLTTTNLEMTSAIAAYNTHCSGREAAHQAAHGYYWAGISAIYNSTTEGKLAAQRGRDAHLALAPLAADGMMCYMQAYLGE